MTPDIHPEDLLDRERAGSLTLAERRRLKQHLASCSSCRIERALAADFAIELELIDSDFESQRSTPGSERAARRRSQAPVPIFRGAIGRTAVVVAALLLAGGAAALNGGLPWITPAEPAEPALSAPATTPGPSELTPTRRAGAARAAQPSPEDAVQAAAPTTDVMPTESTPPAPAISSGQHLAAGRPPVKARSASSVFEEASLARRQGRYETALTLYRQLEREFPGSVEATTAKALRARIELDLGRAGAAATAFKDASATDSPLSEVALVGEAQALGRAGRHAAEARAWELLIQRFPQSPHRPLAEARLRQLGAD